jgi:hypothetical protein
MIRNKGHSDIRLFIINKLLSQDIYIYIYIYKKKTLILLVSKIKLKNLSRLNKSTKNCRHIKDTLM